MDHIVQIDEPNAVYEIVQDHKVISLPLAHPAHGEDTSTLLLKLTCLTSCVGGPHRKPFCIVFSLKEK